MMFDIFGEFDSAEEMNKTAEGLKNEGDTEGLKNLAKENGLSEYDVEDYLDGIIDKITNPLLAALGKIAIECKDLQVYEIMEDWVEYIKVQCSEDDNMAKAVRKKGKSVKGCIAELLKWSFNNQYKVPDEIIKAAKISAGRVTLGIPGMGRAKKIIREYYLGGGKDAKEKDS